MALIGHKSAAQYAEATLDLLPPGKAFSRDPTSNVGALALAFGDEFTRFDQRLLDIIEEADPRTTNEMVGDWERIAGLPDPAIPAPVLLADRQAALTQRLNETGITTPAQFIAIATALGYAATITLHTPFAADISHADDALYDWGSVFWWIMTVTVPPLTVTPVVALEHYVRRSAPDHTYPTFVYVFS